MIVTSADGSRYPVEIRARVVVAAGGSVHTPALLLRSGLRNPNIGRYLRIHPVAVAMGLYSEPMCMWQGVPQSRLVDQLADMDGRGYGVRVETAPAPPGVSGMVTPWESGLAHRRWMAQLPNMANFIVLDRDRYGGRVRLDRRGRPVIDYRLHPYDARHLMDGLLAGLRLHMAAGAREVFTLHGAPLAYRRSSGGDFEAFLREVRDAGLGANRVTLLSAHQMSSCRIAGDARTGAVDPAGETYDARRLYVADGSILPTPSGVNPMITIMAAGHYVAQQIKAAM